MPVLVDLHIHSKYSENASEWFLKRIGASQSYSEPELIYRTAKKRGMDFVTITDHNTIEGVLKIKKKYPDVITGVETTTYFPEDDCKVHILIWGFTEKQFEHIQYVRKNIYDLRDYLRNDNIAHSVAHPMLSVNGKLKLTHVEKLILLFDIFEGISGGSNQYTNLTFWKTINNLKKIAIEKLREKYGIIPYSENSHIKGFTGGSDDHAGLFIGKTYTMSDGKTIPAFLESIKNKKTHPSGNHNNYRSMVFTIYKIAYDFSKTKNIPSGLFRNILDKFFEHKNIPILEQIWLNAGKKSKNRFYQSIYGLMDSIKSDMEYENKFDIAFDKIASLTDELLLGILKTMEKQIKLHDIENVYRDITMIIPILFLLVPFFSSLKHLYSSRSILEEFSRKYGKRKSKKEKRLLWFSDTLSDLNGPSMTLQKVGWISLRKNINIKIVSSLSESDMIEEIPPEIINLPYIYNFKLPGYEKYELKLPSILRSIQMVYDHQPDEIYISTPGFVGLFALLTSYLLSIKTVGIYHTDFTLQVRSILKDDTISEMFEAYIKWFYSLMNEIKVPTQEYIKILKTRNYPASKLKVFKRGIDCDEFCFKEGKREIFERKFNIEKGINLLYAGRISREKGLDFLIDIYRSLLSERKDINLIIAGDGPYLSELSNNNKDLSRLYFIGRIDYYLLPEIYSANDIFIFPSVSDTFGMVVLEAQACSLPCIVSDMGGPKEIIVDGTTGFIAKANDIDDWKNKIKCIIKLLNSKEYEDLRINSRNNILQNYNWEKIL